MGGGGGGNNGIATIPAGSRKVVQSLKEIVDCPEQEIYAALRDCNMDPNEAVNRLLSQDPFHEVKSKREKKKEIKDTTDSRARSNTSNRGGRAGADRYTGRNRASASTTTDSAGFHGKPAYKKENGSHAYGGSSSVASGNSGNRRSVPVSDPATVEIKIPTAGESDAFPGSSSHPSSGFQPAWFGMPGQVSMADIVKMGRPHGKVSGPSNPRHSSNQQRVPPSVPPTHSDFHSLPDHQSSSSRNTPANDDWPLDEPQVPANDEWPQFENTQAPVSSVLEPHDIPLDGSGHQLDEMHQFSDERPLETNATHNMGSSVSSKNVQDDESQAAVQHHLHAYEHNEDEDTAANMQQQLSLEKEEEEDVSAEDDGPAVVIPDHLQVHVADCQHLSFGSFGSIGASFGGPTSSRIFQNDPTEAPPTSDNASISQADISNQEHYGEENLRPASSDVDNVHGTGTSITNYETAPVSETEVLQKDSPEPVPGNQYAFASSGPSYDYDSSQGLGAAFSQTQSSSQMQNLASYSNVLPTAYSSSLPSALLQPSAHTGRESDLTYLPFNVTQSMPTKFSNPASSISNASAETFRATEISTPQQQQASQNLPPASLATGPALPQHLAMHPYSQPTLPLGHFANMVSYPFLPQNYSYMPSAFQQAFAGNSSYHQSLAAAAVLPQYKNSLSVSSLPQSGAAVPAGYGFGSSNSIPGANFPLNQAAAPVGTNIGYEEALSSHYKDAAQLLSLQQNENSAMWMHGLGSRTMQPVPANNYYNYNQGQSQQQQGSLRQGQTPSQHYGALGYPNFYQSAGMSLEQQQQQQMARGDGSHNGSQGQQQKQSPQLWQNNY